MAHDPALAEQVVDLLVPALRGGGVFVDATLGRAGHAARVLAAAPKAELVGIDRDPDAVQQSRAHLAPFEARVRLVREDFKNLAAVLERLGVETVRGVLLDLGVSSPQLDEPSRGFSYRNPGPLDMRMDPTDTLTAADVVNTYTEHELTRVLGAYGEERFARRIARAIVASRPIAGTVELAAVIKDAIPAAARRSGAHPARRSFQALRMEVNRELDALEEALPQMIDALATGGRGVVISYHSLEDRAVKRRLQDEARGCTCPPGFPVCRCDAQVRIRVLTPRPVRPPRDEVARNPRSRAAKLRAFERLGDPLGDDAA